MLDKNERSFGHSLKPIFSNVSKCEMKVGKVAYLLKTKFYTNGSKMLSELFV